MVGMTDNHGVIAGLDRPDQLPADRRAAGRATAAALAREPCLLPDDQRVQAGLDRVKPQAALLLAPRAGRGQLHGGGEQEQKQEQRERPLPPHAAGGG